MEFSELCRCRRWQAHRHQVSTKCRLTVFQLQGAYIFHNYLYFEFGLYHWIIRKHNSPTIALLHLGVKKIDFLVFVYCTFARILVHTYIEISIAHIHTLDESCLSNEFKLAATIIDAYLFIYFQKFHSIVLMAVADADYKFLYIDVGAYGSEGDSSVFLRSEFGQSIVQNTIQLPEDTSIGSVKMPFVFVGGFHCWIEL